MRAAAVIALVIGVGLAAVASTDEHAPLRAAEQELKIARGHLVDAGRQYAGHRQAALEHVNRALAEIRQALGSVRPDGPPVKPERPAPEKDDD